MGVADFLDDSSTARRRGAAPRTLLMRYEVERLYLTDPAGRPEQTIESTVLVDAATSKDAALSFVRNEGARLLGPVTEVRGDLCTATAWNGGRLYVITVWRVGHKPVRCETSPIAN